MNLGICLYKKTYLVKVGPFAWYSVKIRVIFGVRFERRKIDEKKQTDTKTETCKLYSSVFWIFLPNVFKIANYNFELHRFKVCAFFSETQCIPQQLRCKFSTAISLKLLQISITRSVLSRLLLLNANPMIFINSEIGNWTATEHFTIYTRTHKAADCLTDSLERWIRHSARTQ